MRDDGDIEFLGKQENGENFVDTTDTAGVDLTDIDGGGLKELLEDDPVLDHFAGSYTDAVGFECLANGGVAENIVG